VADDRRAGPPDADDPEDHAAKKRSGRQEHRSGTPRKPLLADRTSDEADLIAPTPDEWYERERPPHHG
jgi:hypothetical protein